MADPSVRKTEEHRNRLAAVLDELEQAAAYLPAGKALKEAIVKGRALRPEDDPVNYFAHIYRLQLQYYNASKALGLTDCLGRPPRKPIGG